MQGGECVKCSLIWVKWGRVHRVAGIACNAARERGYTVLERGGGIFGLDGDGRRKWGRKVYGEREYYILYEYATIHPAYYFLYKLILGCGTGHSCGYRCLVLGDFIGWKVKFFYFFNLIEFKWPLNVNKYIYNSIQKYILNIYDKFFHGIKEITIILFFHLFSEMLPGQTCPGIGLYINFSLRITHIRRNTLARRWERDGSSVHRHVLINIVRMEITHVQPPFDALRSRTRKHVLTSRLRPCTVSLSWSMPTPPRVFSLFKIGWLEVVSLLSSELASLPAPIFRYCTRSMLLVSLVGPGV